ncbi:MAG: P-protein [Alphaproteobacteria bacterium MarineAlpha5_Bin5]|nr:MAG: P-protein [Alphaproteobacteria bacterium MarineAlpha5_Bin5]PPR52452.1 MAG: P-protein [Alphaproteobacteria bacterium MarineAlpha5_Bin4]|tara:strand:- start:441 stop:1283 length:843 start_codon:yes stop_codon:yes gene_type:complete
MIKINKFAFQGINGAYSELAGKNIYSEAKSLACSTFEEMFQKVRDGNADVAMVPIENSQAGRVADTQRLIPESELKIIGEYFLEVKHNLLVIPGTKLIDIKRIHSHEQGIAQCRNKIINLNKEMIVATDTAGAAKKIEELNSKEDAAIASELSSKIYNLEILEENFQDSKNNVTRFLIMAEKMQNFNSDETNLITTLVFVVRSIPASLYKCLGGFASNGVNITKLESYVHPQGFDVAQFYIDFEGHPENESVKLALEEMKFFCKQMNILGVYKKSFFRKK